MDNTVKAVNFKHIFSEEDIKLAIKLNNANEICSQITKPKLELINEVTGQENDPKYWAYWLMYCCQELVKSKD